MDSPRDASRCSNPSSSLLQDMIKEKRAQGQRPNRSRDSSNALSQTDSRTDGLQSSPLSSKSNRDRPGLRSRGASGSTNRPQNTAKEMGLREMQEHLSKIDKQNFDLKVEIFHRRQRNEELEQRVLKSEALEAENEQLQLTKDDLALKLLRRDADLSLRETAIEEAVGMICDLEARIEDLEQELRFRAGGKDDGVRMSNDQDQANALSTLSEEDRNDLLSPYEQPNRFSKVSGTGSLKSPRSPRRPPSFLRDDKRSSAALRSLYSKNQSFASLARPSSVLSDEELDEELERQMLHSPRLSILSESGFSSIYGHLRENDASPPPADNSYDPAAEADTSHTERMAQREARIHDWIQERQSHERPKTPMRSSSYRSNARLSSIGEVLQNVPSVSSQHLSGTASSRSQKSATTSSKHSSEHAILKNRSPTKSLRKSAKAHENLSTQTVVFGGHYLPPTPDTMSTATYGPNSSTQSIITEKSLKDLTVAPANGYASLMRDDHKTSDSILLPSAGSEIEGSAHANLGASDEDLESTQVEQSATGYLTNDSMLPSQMSPSKSHSKEVHFPPSKTPVRPALATHATDIMFNGDGFKPKDPARNASYPSPAISRRPLPTQVSPNSRRNSGVPSEKTITSPRRLSPARRNAQGSKQRRSGNLDDVRDVFSNNPPPALCFEPSEEAPDTNRGASHSVASRFFRRTKSQASNGVNPIPDANSARPPSSHRLSRPSSIHVTRPGTSDGVKASSTAQREKQNMRMRRHSAVLDDDIVGLDPETGLHRVTEEKRQDKGAEEGKIRGFRRTAGAKIRDGLGIRR